MFTFHRRERSLIPVSSMDKIEKNISIITEQEEVSEEEDAEPETPRQRRNLTMIYLLFLAEAIMSASLSSQISVLVPSTSACLGMETSFLRSILQCAYYFGSSLGLFWGCAADKLGRRRVALIGLGGMSTCCISMGFATQFPAFALLRFVAGAVGSAATIAGLAMLADVSHGSKRRTKIIARLPLVAVCGSIGPLAAHLWRQAFDGRFFELFAKFPGLSGQIACAGLIFTITGAELWLLEETLPVQQTNPSPQDADNEKTAFLRPSSDSDSSLNITIIEALNDEAASPLPSRIGLSQLLTAPTVTILLTSYSLLALHTSTFETVLPHLGHTPTNTAGMGLPCPWLAPITTFVAILATVNIARLVPSLTTKHDPLLLYRRASAAFPALYTLIPLLGLLTSIPGASSTISALLTTTALYLKTTLAGVAQVLVTLLVLSAVPDAFSTGTVLGVTAISELFKALAVGVSGMAYYFSDGHSVGMVNGALWTMLVVTAGVGLAVTGRLRGSARVGTDIPSECFVWEGVFDSESEEGV